MRKTLKTALVVGLLVLTTMALAALPAFAGGGASGPKTGNGPTKNSNYSDKWGGVNSAPGNGSAGAGCPSIGFFCS